jgi:hypothetical protein
MMICPALLRRWGGLHKVIADRDDYPTAIKVERKLTDPLILFSNLYAKINCRLSIAQGAAVMVGMVAQMFRLDGGGICSYCKIFTDFIDKFPHGNFS